MVNLCQSQVKEIVPEASYSKMNGHDLTAHMNDVRKIATELEAEIAVERKHLTRQIEEEKKVSTDLEKFVL